MSRRLPLLCPSNGSYSTFFSGPCSRAACSLWVAGRCSAQDDIREEYAEHLDVGPLAPPCPKADACTWHREGPCAVRRLGMLCAHIDGGEWNTFAMAPAAEW